MEIAKKHVSTKDHSIRDTKLYLHNCHNPQQIIHQQIIESQIACETSALCQLNEIKNSMKINNKNDEMLYTSIIKKIDLLSAKFQKYTENVALALLHQSNDKIFGKSSQYSESLISAAFADCRKSLDVFFEYLNQEPVPNEIDDSEKKWKPDKSLTNRFTEAQIIILKEWTKNHRHWPYPNLGQKRYLAKKLNVSIEKIPIWFNNYRNREWKKKKSELKLENKIKRIKTDMEKKKNLDNISNEKVDAVAACIEEESKKEDDIANKDIEKMCMDIENKDIENKWKNIESSGDIYIEKNIYIEEKKREEFALPCSPQVEDSEEKRLEKGDVQSVFQRLMEPPRLPEAPPQMPLPYLSYPNPQFYFRTDHIPQSPMPHPFYPIYQYGGMGVMPSPAPYPGYVHNYPMNGQFLGVPYGAQMMTYANIPQHQGYLPPNTKYPFPNQNL